jgi:hypothetical protein
MIEIGVSTGAAVTQPWDGSMSEMGGSAAAYAHLKFLFLNADARFSSVYGADKANLEFQTSGGLLFLKLHELYVRKNDSSGDHTHTAAGLGGDFDLGDWGTLGASVGVMMMEWERTSGRGPGSSEQKSLLGGYAGAHLYLHIWKFENELRVAYFTSPEVNTDVIGIASDAQVTGSEIVKGWTSGMIASDVLRFNAVKFGIFELGPEAAARAMVMPDGTEFVVTFGIGGKIGVL